MTESHLAEFRDGMISTKITRRVATVPTSRFWALACLLSELAKDFQEPDGASNGVSKLLYYLKYCTLAYMLKKRPGFLEVYEIRPHGIIGLRIKGDNTHKIHIPLSRMPGALMNALEVPLREYTRKKNS